MSNSPFNSAKDNPGSAKDKYNASNLAAWKPSKTLGGGSLRAYLRFMLLTSSAGQGGVGMTQNIQWLHGKIFE